MTTQTSLKQVIEGWPSAVLYRLTSPSDAVYIGQTRNLRGRLANYRCIARGKGDTDRQPLLYRSLRKYGFDAHKISVLHQMPYSIDQKALDDYERYAIQMHKNMRGTRLLNVSRGGGGSRPHARVCRSNRPDLSGEKHPLAKLTAADVIAIRRDYRWGSSEFGIGGLASRYGVSKRLIHNVIRGSAWAHIKTERAETRKYMCHFSVADAAAIRERYAAGGCTHRSLALEYGTNHRTIGKIITNPRWGRIHAPKNL